MPEPGSLLIWCLALCALGAVVACLARHRLVFIGLVAAQCLAALGAAGAILASGTPIELALWQLSSFGRLVLVLDPIAALFVTVTAIVFVVGVVFAAREAAKPPDARTASFAAALPAAVRRDRPGSGRRRRDLVHHQLGANVAPDLRAGDVRRRAWQRGSGRLRHACLERGGHDRWPARVAAPGGRGGRHRLRLAAGACGSGRRRSDGASSC